MTTPLTQELSEGKVHIHSRWDVSRRRAVLIISGGTPGTPPERSLPLFAGRRLLIPMGGPTVLSPVTLRGKSADERRWSDADYLWGVPDAGEPVRLDVTDESLR